MTKQLPHPIQGDYLLLEVIGQGGMGVVYKGVHTILEREVAIKILHPNLTADPATEKRFLREARSIGRIKNEHVVEVLNFGKTKQDELYLVMELIEGVILSQALKNEPFLPAERACHIASQMCDALGAAHEQGIVHRDLKPANVILTQKKDDSDFVKLLDFGVAKILDETENTLTRDGLIVGTYSTMAPEQLLGYDVDGRSDLYSLGIVLYTMLTGKPPFRGKDLATLCYQHVHVPPRTPASVNSNTEISPALNACVMRALCKSPDNRYKDMTAFQTAMAQALQNPNEISEETQKALRDNALTIPPTAAGELAILAQANGSLHDSNSEDPTAPATRFSFGMDHERTVSHRTAPTQPVPPHNDRPTLILFSAILFACSALLAWGVATYALAPQPQTVLPPKPVTVTPAPPTLTPPAPLQPAPEPQTQPVKAQTPPPQKSKPTKKQRKRRGKKKDDFRKPDLIRVHTQPTVEK